MPPAPFEKTYFAPRHIRGPENLRCRNMLAHGELSTHVQAYRLQGQSFNEGAGRQSHVYGRQPTMLGGP